MPIVDGDWIPAGTARVADGGYLVCEGREVAIDELVEIGRARLITSVVGSNGVRAEHYRIDQPAGEHLHVRRVRQGAVRWIEEVEEHDLAPA